MTIQVKDFQPGYSIFGNKGNIWGNTAHIYKNGEGNLCGTPALSNNWAKIYNIGEAGCEKCCEKYINIINKDLES